MNPEIKARLSASIQGFSLPAYEEIPDVGLYLEQTAKYISDCLAPLEQGPVTGSMISNYVKKGLIANPVKKQYSRDQIAYLFFIAVAKNTISIDNLRRMIRIQQSTYSLPVAYRYVCSEFDNVLKYVFGVKDTLDTVGVESSDEKFMLRSVITAVAHKAYLDKLCAALSGEETQ